MPDSISKRKIIIDFTGRGIKFFRTLCTCFKKGNKMLNENSEMLYKTDNNKTSMFSRVFFPPLSLYITQFPFLVKVSSVSVFFSMAVYLCIMRSAVKHSLECQDKPSSCPLLINSSPQQRIANVHII